MPDNAYKARGVCECVEALLRKHCCALRISRDSFRVVNVLIMPKRAKISDDITADSLLLTFIGCDENARIFVPASMCCGRRTYTE